MKRSKHTPLRLTGKEASILHYDRKSSKHIPVRQEQKEKKAYSIKTGKEARKPR